MIDANLVVVGCSVIAVFAVVSDIIWKWWR